MDPREFLNTLIFSQNSNISISTVVVALFIAMLLALFPIKLYQYKKPGGHYTDSFLQSLLMFTLLATVITLVIGSNFARAFGLVGVLSIIRFRTALKSPIDAVFTFWALTLGVSCGTANYLAALLLCIFVTGSFLISPWIIGTGPSLKEAYLKIYSPEIFGPKITEKLKDYGFELLNEYQNVKSEDFILIFRGHIKTKGTLKDLEKELLLLDENIKVFFEEGIQPQVYAY